MTRRLRRIATTQPRTMKKRGKAITGPNHGWSFLSSRPTDIGVAKKKFSNRGCGLHDRCAKRGAFCGRNEKIVRPPQRSAASRTKSLLSK